MISSSYCLFSHLVLVLFYIIYILYMYDPLLMCLKNFVIFVTIFHDVLILGVLLIYFIHMVSSNIIRTKQKYQKHGFIGVYSRAQLYIYLFFNKQLHCITSECVSNVQWNYRMCIIFTCHFYLSTI